MMRTPQSLVSGTWLIRRRKESIVRQNQRNPQESCHYINRDRVTLILTVNKDNTENIAVLGIVI